MFINPQIRGSVSLGNGAFPLAYSSDPGYNVAVGSRSLNPATSQYNTSVGDNSGSSITSGGENTLDGSSAGTGITTGSRNICVGANSDVKGSSTGNVVIGYTCGVYEPSAINDRLLIENNQSRNSNKDYLIEGDFNYRWIRFNGALRKRVINITSTSSINSGTAISATIKSITDTSKTFVTNEFQNKFLIITGGVGVGQAMIITQYYHNYNYN